MSTTVKTCKCGSDKIRCAKTSECNRCYQARRRVENPEKFRKAWRQDKAARYVPAEKPQEPRTAPNDTCSYTAAHKRVARWRGSAKEFDCIACGNPAEEWSYRGGSNFEQSGLSARRRNGKTHYVNTTWSGYIFDYDPRCVGCHKEYDSAA